MAVAKKTEFTITCEHKAGELARILEALSGAGVNVLAFVGYQAGEKTAHLMLVPDDAGKAAEAIKGLGVEFKSTDVVAVTTTSGAGEGAKIARKLGDAGINMEYAYATTSGSGDSIFVIGSKDVDGTLKLLG